MSKAKLFMEADYLLGGSEVISEAVSSKTVNFTTKTSELDGDNTTFSDALKKMKYIPKTIQTFEKVKLDDLIKVIASVDGGPESYDMEPLSDDASDIQKIGYIKDFFKHAETQVSEDGFNIEFKIS